MLSPTELIKCIQTRGITGFITASANKIDKFLYKQNSFFLGRTKLSDIPEVDCPIDFTYRNLTPADLEKMRSFRWDLSDYERWFKEGYGLKAAEYNKKIIGFIAFNKKVEPPFNPVSENRKNDIWIAYCNILPEYRGKKICPKIMYLAAKEYLSQGYENFHLAVDADNIASIKMHERAGFIPYLKTKLTTIFGIKKLSIKKERQK